MMRILLLPTLAVVGFLIPLMYLQRQVAEPEVFLEQPFFTPLRNDTDPQEAYPVASLGPLDRDTLINVTSFRYTMVARSTRDCQANRPLILALIHSAPDNYERRATIRATWLANRTSDLVGLFVLGLTQDARLQESLERENAQYGDMVQGSFIDSYRNMTFKHTMSLKLAVYECPSARYIIRVDDDIEVNVPFLMKLFLSISPYGARDLLVCGKRGRTQVIRSYRSKWRVSYREYSLRSYPEFCTGGAVVYSPDVVFRLYKEAQRMPYFWIDDVHITGTAAQLAGIRHNHFGLSVNFFEKDAEWQAHSTRDPKGSRIESVRGA